MERRIDRIGRLSLPAEFRRMLSMPNGSLVKMTVEGDAIKITKSKACCTFCGSDEELRDVKGVRVCQSCVDEIKNGVYWGLDQ